MTKEENILWTKIAQFKLDDENSSFKFSRRLARENGWSISYSEKVIEEYKKFIFLCCMENRGVTPSDQVDQVWHLHLTYTKSYWIDLCKNTLSKEIHHTPTQGGQSEGKKFDNFYTATVKLYKDKFKADPPKTIWPDNGKRFSDINFQRVNLKNYWLFRRPDFSKKNLQLLLIVFISFFSIHAISKSDTGKIIGMAIVFGFILYTVFKNKNGGGSGGSGCSTSGCGGDSGHHGHSGCGGDSGCGGGGCGGD